MDNALSITIAPQRPALNACSENRTGRPEGLRIQPHIQCRRRILQKACQAWRPHQIIWHQEAQMWTQNPSGRARGSWVNKQEWAREKKMPSCRGVARRPCTQERRFLGTPVPPQDLNVGSGPLRCQSSTPPSQQGSRRHPSCARHSAVLGHAGRVKGPRGVGSLQNRQENKHV